MDDLSNVPRAVSPDGSPPNFVSSPSLEQPVLAVGAVLIVISGVLILLRLGTNCKYTGRLAIDDCKDPFFMM